MIVAKELVKDLQEMRDQGYLADALIRRAVKTIAASDDRYDWVGAYLLREDGQTLWLHNYVGSASEHAEIPVGQGVCGGAVTKRANQNIPDVAAIENYVPCSPDVRSELVVLIRAGDDIFGEINLDSEQAAAFKAEDEATVQAVADKLAEQIVAERR
ncbi:MAG: GAF domain-containing protein [Gemmatimonadetes bacterium]|nr:GAF domain-containing protein [Gemmatimonadota bacterium]